MKAATCVSDSGMETAVIRRLKGNCIPKPFTFEEMSQPTT